MNLQSLSIEQLKQVISIKEQIATLEVKLAKFTGGKSLPVKSPQAPAKNARKGVSTAGRARIAAAQKARWAKIKGTTPATPVAAPKIKGRKKMSAAAKAKIAAAAKARWAKIKGTAPTAPVVARKAAPVAKAAKKKGGITPEGRARIVAALKKRWAAAKKK